MAPPIPFLWSRASRQEWPCPHLYLFFLCFFSWFTSACYTISDAPIISKLLLHGNTTKISVAITYGKCHRITKSARKSKALVEESHRNQRQLDMSLPTTPNPLISRIQKMFTKFWWAHMAVTASQISKPCLAVVSVLPTHLGW